MINVSTDQDGIATIEWNMPGRAQNVLNEASIDAFGAAIHQVMTDLAVKGILVASAKNDFHAGADLAMMLGQSDAEHVYALVQKWHKLLRQMETAGKPIAAALSGATLGSGLALALACHYRVAADCRNTSFGFRKSSSACSRMAAAPSVC